MSHTGLGPRLVGMDTKGADPAALFAEYRNLLFTVAYDMLGGVGDAEDVVQDTWLRWSAVDHTTVTAPRAYLVRIATRLALDRLRALRRSREEYVGPWLPEPLWDGPDPGERLVEHEGVAVGMLVVLETLSPLERTAFVLHEVFGFSHSEIAEILQRSPAAVRQLVHRSREHVRARRPRFDVDQDTARTVARRFVDAAVSGDVAELLDVLAPDVVLHNDGGGILRTALRPVVGADNLARLFTHVGPAYEWGEFHWGTQGGVPTVFAVKDGVVWAAASIETDPTGRRVTAVYGTVNPAKLRHLTVDGMTR
ncbi:RNA polymerase sigma factor SigJ [Pseudonocardia spinosispora]|uniref:RNA polymerase sigma factor SigJ n=1 Tax=Pseudonocardia spinosispora TaxID=103441 RepID=UPI001FE191E1|nr:RNA polymerase sigma factor SigJ [Pseudonocardia spinosispora]